MDVPAMVMDTVLQRCAEQIPVTVMATLAMQGALEPDWIDELSQRLEAALHSEVRSLGHLVPCCLSSAWR